jgi:hypothetical protein
MLLAGSQLIKTNNCVVHLVGCGRLELPTSALSKQRSEPTELTALKTAVKIRHRRTAAKIIS